MKQRSFSRQIMRRNLWTLLLCFFLVMMIVFWNSLRYNQTEKLNTQIQILKNHQNSVERTISFTTKSIWQLTQEQSFLEYCLDAKAVNYHMLSVRKSLLQKLSSFDNYCYSVGIIKSSSSIVLTDTASLSIPEYLADIGVTPEQYQALCRQLETLSSGTYCVLSSTSGDPYLTLAARYESAPNVYVHVLITFYREAFLPSLLEGSSFFLLADDEIALRHSSLSEGALAKTEQRVLDASKSVEIPKQQVRVVSGRWASYILMPSDFLVCQYVLAVPASISNFLLSCFLCVMAAALLVLIVHILRGTMSIFSPINEIVTRLQPFYKEKTDENELHYISEATNEIIQTNQSLTEHLERQETDLKNRFLTELLLGVLSPDELASGISEFSLEYVNKNMFVVVMDFYDFEMSGNVTLDLSELRGSIEAKLTPGKNRRLEDLILFKSKYVALFSGFTLQPLVRILGVLLAELESANHTHMLAAVGPLSTSPETVKDSFNTALCLLEYKHILSHKNVLTPNSLTLLDNKSLYYPLDIEHTLINYTISGNKNKVHYILSDIFKANFDNISFDKDLLSEYIQAVLNTVKRCLQLSNLTLDEVFPEGTILYLELKMCESTSALNDKILSLFDAVTDHINAAVPENELTEESFSAYIAQNYDRDLSLADVAEYFRFSQPYTSKQIKQLTGTNFKGYLNRYRIELATQALLKDETIKVNELAQQVGFTNPTSFRRVFKAITGLSPGEYREKFEKNQ